MKPKQILPAVALLLLTACTKNDAPVTTAPPAFSAVVNNIPTNFTNPVTATSEKNPYTGNYELKISGENKLTNDSSIQIRFLVPDFTLANQVSATYTLDPNFYGNFIETKTTPTSWKAKLHYFQQGQLAVQQNPDKTLSGTFHFKYFLWDQYGNKTAEYEILNGSFSNIQIGK